MNITLQRGKHYVIYSGHVLIISLKKKLPAEEDGVFGRIVKCFAPCKNLCEYYDDTGIGCIGESVYLIITANDNISEILNYKSQDRIRGFTMIQHADASKDRVSRQFRARQIRL